MLATHVSSVGQLQYDAKRDFVITTDRDGAETIMPLSFDAQSAFKYMQANLNRVRAWAHLPPVAVNSVINAAFLAAVVEVATNAAIITTVTQPTLVDLEPNVAFKSFVLLAPFRVRIDAANRNALVEDLAIKARLWAAVFGGIADNAWLGADVVEPGVVTFPSTKPSIVLPIVGGTLGGLALGAIIGVIVWRRGR